jgi:hypothetical protein
MTFAVPSASAEALAVTDAPSAATGRPIPLPGPEFVTAGARIGFTLTVATVVTTMPLLAHLVSPLLGVPVAVVLAFVLADRLPRLAPAVLVFAMLFQNTFVSILSPAIADGDAFNFIRGYTFLTTVVVWSTLVADLLLHPAAHLAAVRRTIGIGIALFGLVGGFTLLGLPGNGASAIVYTRGIVTPTLVFHIALVVSGRSRIHFGEMVVLFAGMEFACGWLEMLSRPTWFALTNGETYWSYNMSSLMAAGYWEETYSRVGFVYRDLMDYFRINLFNTDMFEGLEVLRLHGPNIHAIAYGYALAFLALYLVAAGRRWFALLALPLLVLASSKGAMILVGFVVAGWIGVRLIGPGRTLIGLAAALVVYVAATIASGLSSGDFHVIGLMGGLEGFLANPFGRGIGAGGNLTGGVISLSDWSKAQESGSFDGAVESAIGVLLYQMGIATLAVIGHYLWIARRAWRLYLRSGDLHQGLAGLGILIVAVNGLFQEEALFSPLAMGLMTLFAGLVIGAAERTAASSTSRKEIP